MQQMLNQTYRKANIDPDNSSLVKFVNSPLFDLGHFASEATVNFPPIESKSIRIPTMMKLISTSVKLEENY
jgi:hypothetical protein